MPTPEFEVRLERLATLLEPDGRIEIGWREPVRVATTANGTLASAFDDGSVVDGETLVEGDRILIKDQTLPVDNGVYIVQPTGAPERAHDMSTGSDAAGAAVMVIEGTTNEGKVFRVVGGHSQQAGDSDLVWEEFGEAGTAADTAYDDSESIGVSTVDEALDLILSQMVRGGLIGTEIDSWYDEAGTTTFQGNALANVTRQTSPAGPGNRAYLNATGDHQTYLTITGLTVGMVVRVEVQTNGAAGVGGSGGGTFFRLTVQSGNTDLAADQVFWAKKSGQVTIGADGQLALKGVFSPSWGDLIITDMT